MLSILIPVFNFDVRALVEDLHKQAKEIDLKAEIILLDDGSKDEFKIKNQFLKNLAGIKYEELSKNIGRAAIRNRLAQIAQYPYLLFMDNDAQTESPQYIERYTQHLEPNMVIYGGRTYSPTPPEDSSKYFHWYYGSKREVSSASERQGSPYAGFQTNNFLIPKDIFLEIQFDESLSQYGHEDTLFGWALEKKGIPIEHIDNPLRHIGLESFEVFMAKQDKAIANLCSLYKAGKPIETKLLRAYHFLKKARLQHIYSLFFNYFKNSFLDKLQQEQPNLIFLDLYKLGKVIEMM